MESLFQVALSGTLLWILAASFIGSLPPERKDFDLYRVFRLTAIKFLSMQGHPAALTTPPPANGALGQTENEAQEH